MSKLLINVEILSHKSDLSHNFDVLSNNYDLIWKYFFYKKD